MDEFDESPTVSSSSPAPGPGGSPTGDPDTDASDATSEAGDTSASGDDGSGSGSGVAPQPDPEPVGCVTDVAAGLHSFDCDGLVHNISVPSACITEACGLVLDIHGGTMSGQMEDNNTSMRALGDQFGYIVIQSDGPGGMWTTEDDKLLAIVADAVAAWHVDPDRVHVMGFSQGAYMTWRLVCAHADVFASAAPGAGAAGAPLSPAGCSFTGAEVPPAEIDILYMHGRLDPFVDFMFGEAQRDAVVGAWSMGAPDVVASDETFSHTRYSNDAGTHLDFVWHDYTTDAAVGAPPFFGVAIEGHCYPGSTDHTPQEPGQLMGFGCKGTNAFHYGEIAIDFFMEHPK